MKSTCLTTVHILQMQAELNSNGSTVATGELYYDDGNELGVRAYPPERQP